VIKKLNLDMEEVAVAAYVGKAVLVLLRNGLYASTIHSLIYDCRVMHFYDEKLKRKKGKIFISKKEELDPDIKLIIIDEATMVNNVMLDDLLSFEIPIIFIGDNNQLPPIYGVCSVMKEPHYTLKKIMRQAEGNPIVKLSQMILNDEELKLGEYGDSRVLNQFDEVNESMLSKYDIILCGKNKVRENLTNIIRNDILKYPKKPIVGDKMICRQNDWNECVDGIFLTNGLVGILEGIDYSGMKHDYLTIDFRPEFINDSFLDLRLDLQYLNSSVAERRDYGVSEYHKFEFGYVITVHLAQGSEYDNVLYFDDIFPDRDTTKKLRYTAITRASKSIVYVK
jgi:exodeoxyribonuclease-5